MTNMNVKYSSTEAKKLVDEYIDQSAARLTRRLKKAYSEQKKQTTKAKSYA